MSQPIRRRAFLRNSVLVGAGCWVAGRSATSPARSPNEKLNIGIVGVHSRGAANMAAVAGENIAALCDVDETYLAEAAKNHPKAKTYIDWRKMLDQKDLDAVVVSTTEHTHAPASIAAMKRGKHVYCEKPLAHSVYEARLMRETSKKMKVATQMGTQIHASENYRRVVELIQSGAIGPVREAHVWVDQGIEGPRSRPQDTPPVSKNLHWDLWLGPAPKIPWNERHFWHWRCYWAYGTGYAGDLLSHELDFVQYLLGHGIPDNCSCLGLLARLRDDREVPDTWVATYEFEKLGRTVTFTGSMNNSQAKQPVEICGCDATLRFDGIAHDVTRFEILPEEHCPRTDLPKGYDYRKTPRQPDHMEDWVNCMQSRGTPKCSTDEAFIETATFLMSLASYQQRRVVRWDPVREEII